MLAGEDAGTLCAASDDDQLRTLAEPAFGDLLWIAVRVQQVQVLVADLDQVRMLGERCDLAAPALNIRCWIEAHIGVQRDQPCAAFTGYQRQQRVGNRLHHQ